MGDPRALPCASCLIISDGSIAAIIALWREAVVQGGGDSPRPIVWVPAGLSAPAAAGNGRFVQAAGLTEVVAGVAPAATEGFAASAMLLAAGEEAARRGVGRVVWPVQFEALADDRRLARVGVAFDRALLAARLLSVDTRQSMGQSVVIHTPFAELTDDQLLDLAADMDVPVGLAWWCERQADDKPVCGSCGPCRRWSVAMTRAGVVPAVSGLPWSLVEEKPSVTTSV